MQRCRWLDMHCTVCHVRLSCIYFSRSELKKTAGEMAIILTGWCEMPMSLTCIWIFCSSLVSVESCRHGAAELMERRDRQAGMSAPLSISRFFVLTLFFSLLHVDLRPAITHTDGKSNPWITSSSFRLFTSLVSRLRTNGLIRLYDEAQASGCGCRP